MENICDWNTKGDARRHSCCLTVNGGADCYWNTALVHPDPTQSNLTSSSCCGPDHGLSCVAIGS
uniref:Uncharacterized protein n=1 Tax=Anguilla anguilla TaxID=7936 RepID=A0A0E9W8T0_ANGAN